MRLVEDLRSRWRPELNSVLSSSSGLVSGRPLAGLKSSGDDEQEWALRGSGRADGPPFTGEYGGFPPPPRPTPADMGGGVVLQEVSTEPLWPRVMDMKHGSGGNGKWDGGL